VFAFFDCSGTAATKFAVGREGVRNMLKSPEKTDSGGATSCGVAEIRDIRAVLALAGGVNSGTASARAATV
jgi:hypothetical protein